MATHDGEHGFTLIELMIVVGIISILAGILIPNFVNARAQAQTSACESNLRSIATALELLYADQQDYGPAGTRDVTPVTSRAPAVSLPEQHPKDPASDQDQKPSGTVTGAARPILLVRYQCPGTHAGSTLAKLRSTPRPMAACGPTCARKRSIMQLEADRCPVIDLVAACFDAIAHADGRRPPIALAAGALELVPRCAALHRGRGTLRIATHLRDRHRLCCRSDRRVRRARVRDRESAAPTPTPVQVRAGLPPRSAHPASWSSLRPHPHDKAPARNIPASATFLLGAGSHWSSLLAAPTVAAVGALGAVERDPWLAAGFLAAVRCGSRGTTPAAWCGRDLQTRLEPCTWPCAANGVGYPTARAGRVLRLLA